MKLAQPRVGRRANALDPCGVECGPAGRSGDDTGFAAVDALVALMILTTTIVFAMAAVHTAVQTADAASQIRQSDHLLQTLLEVGARVPSDVHGETPEVTWRLTMNEGGPRKVGARLCQQEAFVIFRGSQRRVSLSTLRICHVNGQS